MGPASYGPLLFVVAALAACGPAPSGRQTSSTGALQPSQGSRVAVQPGPPTSSATVQTASIRAGTRPAGNLPPSAPSSPSGAELAAVTDVLTNLQIASFRANAEHCGYIGLDPSGQIMLSPVSRGSEASCELPAIPAAMTLLASFHTHSTYSPQYASEFPTVADMMSDAAYEIAGYISTPGGRLWYVDTDAMTVREICGRGCLPQDPNYRPGDDGPLRPVMSLSYLQQWEGG